MSDLASKRAGTERSTLDHGPTDNTLSLTVNAAEVRSTTREGGRLSNFLVALAIFACIELPNFALVTEQLSFDRLALVLMTVAAILVPVQRRLDVNTRTLLVLALSLIAFKLLLDGGFRGVAISQVLGTATIELFTVSAAFAVARLAPGRSFCLRVLALCLLVQLSAVFLQVSPWHFDLVSVVKPNPVLLIVDAGIPIHLALEGRGTGLFRSAIGLAFVLGCGMVFAWFRAIIAIRGRRWANTIGWGGIFTLALVGIILTQTRSAIYGVIPSLFIGYVLGAKNRWKAVTVSVVAIAVGVPLFGAIEMQMMRFAERTAVTKLDASTYYKLTANIYGAYAALSRNPAFGVTVNRDLERLGPTAADYALVKEGRAALGKILEPPDDKYHPELEPTNHNLFAYYAKYYGLVGLAFFSLILWWMYKLCASGDDERVRQERIALLIFFMQFSFLHNTQLLETPILWIFIALGGVGGQSIGAHVRFQRRPLVGTIAGQHLGSNILRS